MNTYLKNTALLGILTVFTLFIIIWANLVELDEMSRVQGKIIPSSKEKVIQSEFNGRLVKINVKVGDKLKKGEEIARVSDEEICCTELGIALFNSVAIPALVSLTKTTPSILASS